MKVWENVVIGVVIVFIFGLLLFFNGDFSGEVVWAPEIVLSSCNDSEIVLLWDEFFKESSDDVVIFDVDGPGDCHRMAFKIIDSHLWILLVETSEYGYSAYLDGVLYALVSRSYSTGGYFNFSFNIVEEYGMPTTI